MDALSAALPERLVARRLCVAVRVVGGYIQSTVLSLYYVHRLLLIPWGRRQLIRVLSNVHPGISMVDGGYLAGITATALTYLS
jgi:hypothetical protein